MTADSGRPPGAGAAVTSSRTRSWRCWELRWPPACYGPASGGSLPGIGAVPAPGSSPAPLTGSRQAIVTKVKPGVVIINTTLQYNREAAAGTGMVLNADGLVLTNNHVIENSTKITATVPS